MSVAVISELVGLIITGVGLVFSIIKWVKELKEKDLKKIIEDEMVKAEEMGMSGEQKLKCVITVLYEIYGKGFKKHEEKAKAYIEECVAFSKKINNKK